MSKKEFQDDKKQFGQLNKSNDLDNKKEFGDKSYVSTSKNHLNSDETKNILSPNKPSESSKENINDNFGISLKRRMEIIIENKDKIINFNEEQRKLEEYYYDLEENNYDEYYSGSDSDYSEEDNERLDDDNPKSNSKYYSRSSSNESEKENINSKKYFSQSKNTATYNENESSGSDREFGSSTDKRYVSNFDSKTFIGEFGDSVSSPYTFSQAEKKKFKQKAFKYERKVRENPVEKAWQDALERKHLGFIITNPSIDRRIDRTDRKYKKLYNKIDKLDWHDPMGVRGSRIAKRYLDQHGTYYGDRNSIQKDFNQKLSSSALNVYKVARNAKNIKEATISGLIAFNIFRNTGQVKDLFINNQLVYSSGRTVIKAPSHLTDYVYNKSKTHFDAYGSNDLESELFDKVENQFFVKRNRFRSRHARKRKNLTDKKNYLSQSKVKMQNKAYFNQMMSKDDSYLGSGKIERALNKKQVKRKKKKELLKKRKKFKSVKWYKKFKERYKQSKEAIKKIIYFMKSKGFLIALIIFFILIFVGSCFSCVSGCTGGLMGSYNGNWQTENESDATKVEEWYKNAEFEFYQNLGGIEDEYPDYDEYNYEIDPATHDYIALCSYLTAKLEKWNYEGAISHLQELFEAQYNLDLTESTRLDSNPVRDGQSGSYKDELEEVKILNIKVTNNGLDNCKEFFKSLLDADRADWFEDMYKLIGNNASITPPCDGWEDTITRPFGLNLVDKEYKDYITLGQFKGAVKAPFYGEVVAKGENSITVKDDSTEIEIEYMNTYSSLPVGARIKSGGELGQAVMLKIRITTPKGNVLNPAYYFQRSNYNEESGTYEETGNVTTWNPSTGDMKDLDIPVEGEDMKKIMKLYQKYKGSCYLLGAEGEIRGTQTIIGDRGKKAYQYYSDYWFDCSGLVWRLFNESGVKNFGRSTAATYYTWCNVFSSIKMAKPGDLVFFRDTTGAGKGITHVGIYIGEGKFIHSSKYNPSKPFTSETGIDDVYGAYWKDHSPSFGRLP